MIARERLVLIGHPVSHSLSPVMQNAALKAMGLPLRYEALDVPPEQLVIVLAELSRCSCAGNITAPHKKSAMQAIAGCSELARRAGAVNTFWSDGGGTLEGDNTDVAGFDAAVIELLGGMPDGARVAVLGAGGAAGAVLTAVDAWPGATATVHARDLARAMAMRMRHSAVVRACSMRDPCLAEADLVVNATPIGMGTDEMPEDLERLAPHAVVFDLVYGPRETAWVRAARAMGHTASDGLRMLLHQGVASFERWFATPPDAEVMWKALLEATGRG
ncbi:MAG: shikimate dehydrogenase [Gemmatimonadaceae bacterium]|nr:shikimate dehydrogenase [Gemmatimonadaceae bacterium]